MVMEYVCHYETVRSDRQWLWDHAMPAALTHIYVTTRIVLKMVSVDKLIILLQNSTLT